MRVIFAGTPDFAVPAVEALAASSHQVALVVTPPSRPAGRRRSPSAPPVRQAAERLGLPVLQTEDINSPASWERIGALAPDVVAVVAFGQKLGRRLLSAPRHGCVNVHASLLPALRGAAPIAWAILRGHTQTGITTQRMAPAMDAGDILMRQETPIGLDETSGQLHDRLAPMGADLLVRTLDGLEAGQLRGEPQDHSQATLAPRLRKEDGIIDWRRAAEVTRDQVRGLTPWPSAYTFLRRSGRPSTRLVVQAAQVQQPGDAPLGCPGQVLEASRERLVVATGHGALRLLRLQRAGGSPMDAGAFLRGFPLRPGECLHGSA